MHRPSLHVYPMEANMVGAFKQVQHLHYIWHLCFHIPCFLLTAIHLLLLVFIASCYAVIYCIAAVLCIQMFA